MNTEEIAEETLIEVMQLIKNYCMENSDCNKCIFYRKRRCILQIAPINWELK